MSKQVRGVTSQGKEWWVLCPNISVYSFAVNPKKINYLEIFYYFCQSLLKDDTLNLTSQEKRDVSLKSLIELDNKVVAIKYLAAECQKKAHILINRKDKKKKIYDSKPYQIFLVLCESYLDTLHSIYNLITNLDKLLKKDFSKKINNEEWFNIDIDLRNVFHHSQSPLVSTNQNDISFIFEKLPRDPRFLNESMRNQNGRFEFSLSCENLGSDILTFLQKWAKSYIDLINDNEVAEVVTGHYKDGRTKTKKITLGQIKLNLNQI
jgi:hypothetical protein